MFGEKPTRERWKFTKRVEALTSIVSLESPNAVTITIFILFRIAENGNDNIYEVPRICQTLLEAVFRGKQGSQSSAHTVVW